MNETTIPTDRSVTPRRRILIIAAAVTAALLLSGGAFTAYAVTQAQVQAEKVEAERVAAAEAEEARLVDLYGRAADAAGVQLELLVTDVTALSESTSPLMSAESHAALEAILLELENLDDSPSGDADSKDLRDLFRARDDGAATARLSLAELADELSAAAQAVVDAAPQADPATIAAAAAAKEAFLAAIANKGAAAEPFAALTAAAAAVTTSHNDAAAMAAAAAEAAKSGKKTYTHNGQTYYSGTVTPVVPGTTTPPSPGSPGTPSEPVKSAATKATELAAKYGGSTSVAGACVALNYGHVTGTSAFGPSATYDGYYSAVSVTSEAHPNYVNYYAVQWYACPN